MTAEQQGTNRMEREVELLWGLRQPEPRRGPKPRLSREGVVAAAVAIADAEGLEAVSMQRVAKELGYTTMSLYRYVDSKEDMLALMSDAVLEGDPPPPREDGDWRSGVEEWVRESVAMYRRHPWGVYLTLNGPPSGPNGLRWMESGLREISRSGLEMGWSLQMLTMLSAILRETVRIELDMSRAARAAGSTMADTVRDYSRGLRRVVTEEEFPTITRLLREGVMEELPDTEEENTGGPTEDLDFSIRRVLDGIDVYVERQRAAGERGSAPGAGE
ncbi:TetR/AcrR family transcriptional regulator [Nocardiopsis alborubida]|uniref:TetR/AcrR family transcriptional regulator n=1 Tax=Nocardiopsis alborubida TaxID=146802 RepID=A0A7X6MI88_9ACTN|nr:TetR/AcrR family transcriptional regulator [Nocardiopsis alborubida]NKZ01238.1 TetR/AcrR family transcriptional regulator [Nocardiopsis alborubida]